MAHSQEKKWLETIPEEFQTLGSLVKDVKSIILHTLKSLEANQNPKAEQNETKMHVTKNQRNREHNVNKELEIIKRNQTDILEHKGVTDASWAELYPPHSYVEALSSPVPQNVTISGHKDFKK